MSNKTKQDTKTDDINIFKESLIIGQTYKDVLSKKDLWKEIAELYHGEFKIKQTISKDISSFRMEIPYKNHLIILTESDTKPLKFETEIRLNITFEFNISWEDNFERILKLFGKHDIKIGDLEFDKQYLIQSNDSELITKILNYKALSTTFLKYNIYLMNLEYIHKNGLHKLMVVKDRNTKNKEIMIELIEIQFNVIDFFSNENILHN